MAGKIPQAASLTQRDSPLQAYMRRRVSWLAQQESLAADELFRLAAGVQRDWTPKEWAAVLAGLDKCRMRVAEWLEEREGV